MLLALSKLANRTRIAGGADAPGTARDSESPRSRLAALTAIAIVLLLISSLGVGPLEKRWRESGNVADFLNLGGRLKQNENSWRIIADHPLWGVGPGAYESAFRTYGFKNAFKPARDDPKEAASWKFFYAKAHNDWLQAIAEWGFPAIALIIFAILLAGLAPLSNPKPIAPSTVALWTSLLTLLSHATFDYPLQNHAILILATLLLAICSAPREPASPGFARESFPEETQTEPTP